MFLKGFLLPTVICCFGDCYSSGTMTGGELLFVTLCFSVIISALAFYYDRIPKSNFNENDIQLERKTSRWPKLFVYLLFIIPAIILFIEFFNFGNLFTGFDVFMLCSLVALILYLNITPKIEKVLYRQELDNPIYQTKDVFLQSNSSSANLIITQSATSTWVKVLAFILIAFVVVIPVDQLFGVVNSFY